MKHLKSYKIFENKIQILTSTQIDWLEIWSDRAQWSINPDTGLVDVKGDVICDSGGLKDFKGIKFGHIKGTFSFIRNEFTTLEGAPQKTDDGFFCQQNLLTNLVGAPQEVGGDFYCNDNNLTSLLGAPKIIKGQFCSWNNPVSRRTLEKIYKRMQMGIDYYTAISSLKKEIPQNDWDLLDKSGLGPDLEKGGSLLGRSGAFDI